MRPLFGFAGAIFGLLALDPLRTPRLLLRARLLVCEFGLVRRLLLAWLGELDHEALVFGSDGRPAERLDEAGRCPFADLEIAFVRSKPDRSDFGSGHMT